MNRQEIYDCIKLAKRSLQSHQPTAGKKQGTPPASIHSKVPPGAKVQYFKIAQNKFGFNSETGSYTASLESAEPIIAEVHKANTVLTLRKWARSIRFVAQHGLHIKLKQADESERNGDWASVEKIVCSSVFNTFITLSRMMPADYRVGWKPKRPRKSKKTSLAKLPNDWREQLAAISSGQYRIPTLVALVTGCRPNELQKGILIERIEGALYATIKGAKVKETAGQPTRRFCLATHPVTSLLNNSMGIHRNSMVVQVESENSVTTHMRALGKKLWPKRKSTITVYSARHAMAADCKAAIAAGADPDLVSKTLGHFVDKTASYYGVSSQSGGISMAPSQAVTTRPIKHKAHARNAARIQNGQIPGSKKISGRKFKPGG